MSFEIKDGKQGQILVFPDGTNIVVSEIALVKPLVKKQDVVPGRLMMTSNAVQIVLKNGHVTDFRADTPEAAKASSEKIAALL